ncbi:MAG: hypothetical protein Q9209_004006 [Squamulea sp. 1 TL-2023]
MEWECTGIHLQNNVYKIKLPPFRWQQSSVYQGNMTLLGGIISTLSMAGLLVFPNALPASPPKNSHEISQKATNVSHLETWTNHAYFAIEVHPRDNERIDPLSMLINAVDALTAIGLTDQKNRSQAMHFMRLAVQIPNKAIDPHMNGLQLQFFYMQNAHNLDTALAFITIMNDIKTFSPRDSAEVLPRSIYTDPGPEWDASILFTANGLPICRQPPFLQYYHVMICLREALKFMLHRGRVAELGFHIGVDDALLGSALLVKGKPNPDAARTLNVSLATA